MNDAFTSKQTYGKYLKYLVPSIFSMVFVSFYTTVDGFFVSRYVGANALAAINIIIPITCVSYGIAVMLATGGGAIVGIKLGQKDKVGADRFFSFILATLCVLTVVLTVSGLVFLKQILRFCGSTDILMEYTMPYGFWTVLMTPVVMLKLFFEYFARVDGNPKLAMFMSVSGLVLNFVFDYIFVVHLELGISGAGIGTGLSILLSGLIGVAYFLGKRSFLKIRKPKVDWRALLQSCYNGSSEMLTELSTGITTLLFNLQLLKYCGEKGVAAMSVITYLFYFFIAVFFGIAVGSQPLISYSYGAGHEWKIKEVLHHAFFTIVWSSLVVFAISYFLAEPIIRLFTTDVNVLVIAVPGLKLFSFGFLLIGFNVFVSSYFTAIGSGGISALISVDRALIFVVGFLYLLTRFMGINGVWLTVPAAEATTLLFSLWCMKFKARYSLPEQQEYKEQLNSWVD